MKKIDIKSFLMMIIDLGFVYYAYFFASLLISDFNINYKEMSIIIDYLFWLFPIYIIIFMLFRLYSSLWEYASIKEAFSVLFSVITSYVVILAISVIFDIVILNNLLIISHMLIFLFLISIRYSYRTFSLIKSYKKIRSELKRTLIIGAGSAGSKLIKEMKTDQKIVNNVICLVDDDLSKLGKTVCGVRVVGSTDYLPNIVSKYQIDELIISIPSLSKSEYQKLLKKCEPLNVRVKVFPPFYQLIDKRFSLDKIREIDIEDLLGRPEIKIENHRLYTFLHNEVVLVTGGGGSIGKEICRQILKYHPHKIIIFDIYENNAYDIQNEISMVINKMHLYTPEIVVLIGSVQDEFRLEQIFNEYKPKLVFHAAAHKHVPLMEECPNEAIKNNVFGTYNIAKLSVKYNVKKFILISSDKAVNPTNIMGATKRLSEMVINAFSGTSDTNFIAVRFGNVLGSNGSVIPLFKKQIETGGPVTVTHKDIYRYFMTIAEAVSLVLQATSVSNGGEIFVLDMGKPVRILDLAIRLIKLSGYRPYEDIEIKFTGLRPGEKLYEELLMADEDLAKTEVEKILVLKQGEIKLSTIEDNLEELKYLIQSKGINIKHEVMRFIPT